jgi:16S rRNA (guanine(966)-N(2))-methyltransferase RsmD
MSTRRTCTTTSSASGRRTTSSLRITAGTLRGRRIRVPETDVRPTSERARQAYFNIVGDRIDGARFLDLFAGSGVFTFEALSRGAAAATAVDSSRRNIVAIERLAKEWNAPVKAIVADVFATLTRIEDPFDLVYADPPYDFERYDELVLALDRLKNAPLIAIEHRRRTTINPHSFVIERVAEYGEVWLTFLRRDKGEPWN